jgi:hypothetical protein
MSDKILKSMSNYSLKRLGSKLFKAFLVDGGDNYLELNFINEDTGQHYSVTVKPEGKITQGHKNVMLEARIAELEALCKECADYLDTNKFTNIHNDSYLHRDLRSQALKEQPKNI